MTLTADSLKQGRLDQRFHEPRELPAFAVPAFQTQQEAAARRWEERQAAIQQASIPALHAGYQPGPGHATSPATGNV